MDQEQSPKESFFSRISKAIFEEVEATPPLPPGTAAARTSAPSSRAGEGGELPTDDDQLLQEMSREVASHGLLLGQFIELTASLKEIIPQESASFQAALKALEQTSGATRAALLAAADEQLAALQMEKSTFAKSVEGKMAALAQSSGKAEKIRARINELQKSIQALEAEEQQLFTAMAAEEKLIHAAQFRFDSVIKIIEREIQSKLEKIRNYLPEPPPT